MDEKTFAGLQYGNVVSGPGGIDKFIVTSVIRDQNNNAVFIGLTPALDQAKAAQGWTLESAATVQTSLVGRTIQPPA